MSKRINPAPKTSSSEVALVTVNRPTTLLPVKKVLRTPDAAEYTGLAVSTLEKMRLTGNGPEFIRLSARAVGYEIEVLDRWLESRRRRSTSDTGGWTGQEGPSVPAPTQRPAPDDPSPDPEHE
jgi:predicted DNA-binding transcriptional regulator AlpA